MPGKTSGKCKAASARRASRASEANAATLVDLLSTLPSQSEASVGERLASLVVMCEKQTCRQVQHQSQEQEDTAPGDEDDDEAIAAVATRLRTQHAHRPEEQQLELLLKAVTDGSLLAGGQSCMDPEKRKLTEYIDALGREHTCWKDVLRERKETRINAQRKLKEVTSGRIFLKEEQKHHLTFQEKSMLAPAVKVEAVVKLVKSHISKSEVMAMAIAKKSKSVKRKCLEDLDELTSVAKKLISKADAIGGRITSNEWLPNEEVPEEILKELIIP